MARRRVTPSQFNRIVRKAQRDTRQAVDKYNREVRKHNTDVKRAVNDYNREVRAYNSRVRANRRRLDAEIKRLNRQRSTTQFVVTQSSTWRLREAFTAVDEAAAVGDWTQQSALLAELAEAETANSVRVANALLGDAAEPEDSVELAETSLSDELSGLSVDLDQRWRGALFSLNPRNPDAARHFCASVREVLVQMLDLNATDPAVLAATPACPTTKDGRPTRRAKIMYLLRRSGVSEETLATFIEQDVNDVMELFGVVNSGTHGTAGKFDFNQLAALKTRVEGAVQFLSAVIRG